MALPAGSDWYDWWDPAGDALPGGTTLSGYDASDRARIPLFVRAGAIVPLYVATDVNALGTAASAGFLTVLAWPGAASTSFRLHELDESVTRVELVPSASGVEVTFTPARASVLVRLRLEAAPLSVEAGGVALAVAADRAALDAAPAGFLYDAAARWLWVKSTAGVGSITVAR